MKKKKVAKDEATAPVDFVLPREIWVLVAAAGVDANVPAELAMPELANFSTGLKVHFHLVKRPIIEAYSFHLPQEVVNHGVCRRI